MREDVQTAGFAVIPGVFPEAEALRFGEALVRPELGRAGARHLLGHPIAREVASDERLMGLARQILGASAVPFRATLFDKSRAANWLVVWHQDTALPLVRRQELPGWGPWSSKAGVVYAHAPAWALERVVALRLSLTDSTPTNGSLRVLPGSHRHGVLGDDEIGRLVAGGEPQLAVVPAGSVLVMRPLLVHASSKSESGAPRRVLHLEYAGDLRLSEDLCLAIA